MLSQNYNNEILICLINVGSAYYYKLMNIFKTKSRNVQLVHRNMNPSYNYK